MSEYQLEFEKRLEKEKREAQRRKRENRNKIRRFDDIFRMLLIIITIIIAIGSNSFGNVNLWTTIIFILLALILWMFGHSIGAKPIFEDLEVWLKLYAWAFASLVAPIVFLKFALNVSTLSYSWVGVCVFASIFSTFLPYRWLGKMLSKRQKNRFLRYLAFIFLIISYMVNTGTLII